MRLLYVIDSLAPGGAETSLLSMAPGLIGVGIQLDVIPLGAANDLAAPLRDTGAAVHSRDQPPGRLNNVKTVMGLGRRIQPDLVHTTLFESDVAGRTAGRLLGLPISTSIVNDSYSASHYAEAHKGKLTAARTLDAITSTFATRFHAITRAIADSVAPRLGISRSKVDVIPRGRDPRTFPYKDAQARADLRRELVISDSTKVVLAIGRHEPQKGIQHLLDALPTVASALPDLVVLLAGKDGRVTKSIRQHASTLGVDVRFLGHRKDVAKLLAGSDVLCFPSEREGFGGVLIEAMAAGCAVVASDIPTSREVLSELDPVGRLTPVGDHQAIAASLIDVLSNRQTSGDMIKRAHLRFLKHYTNQRVVERMAEFFEQAARSSQR